MSYAKLRGIIVEKFRTQSAFAEVMGMNVATLNGRLNNRSQWTAGEITKACDLLGIPLSEAHHYFFCKQSCDNATA
jgi:transcriptional regulator with XRE-family HTH domain